MVDKPTRIRLIIPEEVVMQPRFTVGILVLQAEGLVCTGGVIYFASEDWEQKNGRNPLMTGITAIFLSGNRGALFFQKLVKIGQNFGAEWSGSG